MSKGVDPNVKDENGHARPETVWSSSKAETKPAEVKAARLAVAKVIVKGLPASPGVAYGKAKVCPTLEDAKRLMRMGDILVTKMTDPDWVPYMRLASAIVTDEGGITAHAAIVSRELGIPCIVETRVATMVMKTGEYYTVDARAGIVYEGYVEDLLGRKEEPASASLSILGVECPGLCVGEWGRLHVRLRGSGTASLSLEGDVEWLDPGRVMLSGEAVIEVRVRSKTSGELPVRVVAKSPSGEDSRIVWLKAEERAGKCPVCGAPVEPGAKYCWNCGAKLS